MYQINILEMKEEDNEFDAFPYPANHIIRSFFRKITEIQPGFPVGIYLTGSIAMNDFYPFKSDIDFVVVCKEIPDKKIAGQLKQIHNEIAAEYPKPDLSGYYIASGTLELNDPGQSSLFYYHEGKTGYRLFEMGPVALTEIKSNAITLLGPDAANLPFHITRNKLNDFLFLNNSSYWGNWIRRHSSYFGRKLILVLFPRFTEWVILGIARQLVTLQTGKIVSKAEAGIYCLTILPARFHSIVQEAIDIRKDDRTYPIVGSYAIRPSFRRWSQTLVCARYMVSLFREKYYQNVSNEKNEI